MYNALYRKLYQPLIIILLRLTDLAWKYEENLKFLNRHINNVQTLKFRTTQLYTLVMFDVLRVNGLVLESIWHGGFANECTLSLNSLDYRILVITHTNVSLLEHKLKLHFNYFLIAELYWYLCYFGQFFLITWLNFLSI